MQHDLVIRATEHQGGILTLHLGGVIDAHTLDKFEHRLAEAMQQGIRSLVLDCEELRYVNSSGFGELIRYFDRLREQGGTLVLARVAPKVGIILEMLGLKSLIPMASSLDAALETAKLGPAATPAAPLAAPAAAEEEGGRGEEPPVSGHLPEARGSRIRAVRPVLSTDKRTVVCAFCDTRLRIGGEGRWACPACGAPFATTREGGVAFDWSRADAEAVHLTFDVTPRALAGFAGLLEGILVERRVPHARMRRFAREAAHVCHLIAENAFEGGRKGPLHVLALAGPQRLHLRIVDRGRALGADASRVFATQSRLFLDFRYATVEEHLNVTEFAFAYAGSGVFVS
ncbi:MAG TPA: STAS domain-containing protein [Planctomycetota bacterium]|nr:STAS domain-containing protein [Planctomycetota bacterium]